MKNERMKSMWNRIRGDKTSSYKQMKNDDGNDDTAKKNTHFTNNPHEPKTESKQPVNKDVKKEKKKRKGWKRVRHAALMTCRYIGLGVSFMSPMSLNAQAAPDYNVDPIWWYNSVRGKPSTPPHWTTGIILNGW